MALKKEKSKSKDAVIDLHSHRGMPWWIRTPFALRVEKFIDYSIPPLVLLLGIFILLEFIHGFEEYSYLINMFDYVVVAFFVADLTFKWYHTRKLVPFVKNYWLDILAVFPFYLAFRVWQELIVVGTVAQEVSEAQKFAHEIVLVRETRLLKEAELFKEARIIEEEIKVARMTRGIRVGQRAVRAVALVEEDTRGILGTIKHKFEQWKSRRRARLLIAHAHMHKRRNTMREEKSKK